MSIRPEIAAARALAKARGLGIDEFDDTKVVCWGGMDVWITVSPTEDDDDGLGEGWAVQLKFTPEGGLPIAPDALGDTIAVALERAAARLRGVCR
jgi:hypothetical protein